MDCLKWLWRRIERLLFKQRQIADMTPDERFWVLYGTRDLSIDTHLDTKE
jgi:hypothetical protein